jgi:hypothetical protein
VDDLVIVASTEDKMQRAVIGINQYSYKIWFKHFRKQDSDK